MSDTDSSINDTTDEFVHGFDVCADEFGRYTYFREKDCFGDTVFIIKQLADIYRILSQHDIHILNDSPNCNLIDGDGNIWLCFFTDGYKCLLRTFYKNKQIINFIEEYTNNITIPEIDYDDTDEINFKINIRIPFRLKNEFETMLIKHFNTKTIDKILDDNYKWWQSDKTNYDEHSLKQALCSNCKNTKEDIIKTNNYSNKIVNINKYVITTSSQNNKSEEKTNKCLGYLLNYNGVDIEEFEKLNQVGYYQHSYIEFITNETNMNKIWNKLKDSTKIGMFKWNSKEKINNKVGNKMLVNNIILATYIKMNKKFKTNNGMTNTLIQQEFSFNDKLHKEHSISVNNVNGISWSMMLIAKKHNYSIEHMFDHIINACK